MQDMEVFNLPISKLFDLYERKIIPDPNLHVASDSYLDLPAD